MKEMAFTMITALSLVIASRSAISTGVSFVGTRYATESM